MKKLSRMNELREEERKENCKLVLQACEECIDSSIEITYGNIADKIADKSGISKRTLERDPYKSIIAAYRDTNEEAEKLDSELVVCREKIRYLKDIIKQLNKENHELKTRLYIESKI